MAKKPHPPLKVTVYRALSLSFTRQDASLSVSIMCVHGLAFHWSRLGPETLSEEAGVSPPHILTAAAGHPPPENCPQRKKKEKKVRTMKIRHLAVFNTQTNARTVITAQSSALGDTREV